MDPILSLLLGLLESTGVAGRPQSYFRVPDERKWAERWRLPRTPDGGFAYADYVDAARTAGRTGNGVFGAKLMWGTHEHLITQLGRIHPDLAADPPALLRRVFGRTRFVQLRRTDELAQAVSWVRAEQTGTWFVGGHGEISGRDGTERPPTYDADRITDVLRMIREHTAGWEQWFTAHGIQPYPVRYEDLTHDLTGVTHAVLDSLGLARPAGQVVTARHERQRDQLNAEWISRYRAGVSDSPID